jgi:hypothetical protein
VKSPLIATLVTVNCPLPKFEICTVCAAEVCPTAVPAKFSAAGESCTPGGAVPVPESATVCDRNWSDTVITPESVPAAIGVKATAIVQLECPARVAPQPLVAVKLPPLTCTAISVSALSPVFVKVTGCVGLAVPTC